MTSLQPLKAHEAHKEHMRLMWKKLRWRGGLNDRALCEQWERLSPASDFKLPNKDGGA